MKYLTSLVFVLIESVILTFCPIYIIVLFGGNFSVCMPMVSAGLYFQVSSTPTKMLGTPIAVVGRDAVAQ